MSLPTSPMEGKLTNLKKDWSRGTALHPQRQGGLPPEALLFR